jgi:SSS family solute:Na+ symporter
MLWIPFLQAIGNGQLYTYLQMVQSLLAPAISAVFMLGIFSKRVTPHSGLIGIAAGFLLGMARLGLVVSYDSGVKFSGLLETFVTINWLYFSFFLFAFTCALIAIVSVVTKPATEAQMAGLTYGSMTTAERAEDAKSYGGWEILHTMIVLAIIVGIYIYFW